VVSWVCAGWSGKGRKRVAFGLHVFDVFACYSGWAGGYVCTGYGMVVMSVWVWVLCEVIALGNIKAVRCAKVVNRSDRVAFWVTCV